MSNIDDLKDVLKTHLEDNGTLNQIRSQIRSEIYQALNDGETKRPNPTREN
jgi:hypothetical protein